MATARWQFALAYLYNIVIIPKTPGDHIHQDRKILAILTNAGVTFKFEKRLIFTETIDYLGHEIRSVHLEIASLEIAPMKRKFRIDQPT